MKYLRKLTAEDGVWISKWRNDNARCFVDQTPLTAQMHRHWYHETYMDDPADHMYVVLNKDGHGVGTMGLRLLESEVQRVLLGDRLNAEPGLMGRALNEMLAMYGRKRYWLRVLRNNERAIRFYQKNWFGICPPGDTEMLTMYRSSYEP